MSGMAAQGANEADGPLSASCELDGPGFAAVAHVPEHPLVPAGGDEVARHRRALARLELERDGVGAVERALDDAAELGGGVGADPARVERVGRAAPLQRL